MTTKQRFGEILYNKAGKEFEKAVEKVKKTQEYKILTGKIDTIEKKARKEVDVLKKKRSNLMPKPMRGFDTSYRWDYGIHVRDKFYEEYEQLDLIFEKKRRMKAKEKLLKKYGLWK
jgi:hypothetical protein